MKEVNFKELSLETTIDKFEQTDLSQEIGNALHRKSTTVPMSDLARKIYYTDGVVSMTDGEYKQMLSLVAESFVLFVSEGIKKATVHIKDEKEESHD